MTAPQSCGALTATAAAAAAAVEYQNRNIDRRRDALSSYLRSAGVASPPVGVAAVREQLRPDKGAPKEATSLERRDLRDARPG